MPSMDDVSDSESFNDIEMLEIPEDFSETDSISDVTSDDTHSSGKTNTVRPVQPVPSYIKLQDWLNSNEKFAFKFDAQSYKQSLKQKVDPEYLDFSNSLYKVFIQFSDNDLLGPAVDMQEPIGVISDSFNPSIKETERLRARALSDSLSSVIEIVSAYVKTIDNVKDDEIVYEYQQLLSVLDCLRANYFYDDANSRPELLAEWINKIDPKPETELVESVMSHTPKPYLHPQFWNTYLAQLLTRGLLSQAVHAIEKSHFEELSNGDDDTNELYSIIKDFSSILANYSNMSLKHQFDDWKLVCCELRDGLSNRKIQISNPEHVRIVSQIYDLLCIITGFPKTIAEYCDTWYEMYTALSLYQVRYEDSLYKEYYQLASSERPCNVLGESNAVWEQICWNIMEENFLKALTIIDAIDSPVAAYISRLLEIKGLLKTYYSSRTASVSNSLEERTISQYLLTKYSYQCLLNHDLVPIGIGILLNKNVFISSQSRSDNRKCIAEFLPHFVCNTNDDLEWALTICAQLNLKSTAQTLYLNQGRKSLSEGYLFEAMNMFVNCYNPEDTKNSNNEGMKELHRIAWDIIFQDALINSRPISDELINNIVTRNVGEDFEVHPVIRQCISPYAVLVEFFNSLKGQNFQSGMEKISKLIHLLRFNFLPARFSPLLLCQILPFLMNSGQYQFQLPDLIIIVELIDSYETHSIEDKEEGNVLYKCAIENIEEDVQEYDWRLVLKKTYKQIPKEFEEIIRILRNEVVAKIGKVYVDEP
ncbi:nucleoporin Nup85p [[Candida] anglica]|uniref:Nuclear pore complex protein Nup85 n=1 Tax=[Candida] anglica TaxID=148631 RepID=A0ABP0ELP5_9ASCO